MIRDMPWLNKSLSADDRTQKLIEAMNFTEKASMVRGRGSTKPFTGHTLPLPRVAIPQLNMNDGPQGIRIDDFPGTSTQFPST